MNGDLRVTDPTIDALDGQDLTDTSGLKDGFRWTPPHPPPPDEPGHVVDPAWYEEPWAGWTGDVRSL